MPAGLTWLRHETRILLAIAFFAQIFPQIELKSVKIPRWRIESFAEVGYVTLTPHKSK